MGGERHLARGPPTLLLTCAGRGEVPGCLLLVCFMTSCSETLEGLSLRSFSAETMIGDDQGAASGLEAYPPGLVKFQEPRNFQRKAQNSENLSTGGGGVGAAAGVPVASESGVALPEVTH